MIIQASITAPPANQADWYKRWEGPDKGLICAWLRGIEKATQDPLMVSQAKRGELPVTVFRGGILKALKIPRVKIGSLHYLAYWQGLRGEDLCVDLDSEPSKTCTATQTVFIYTSDISKLLQQDTSEDDES